MVGLEGGGGGKKVKAYRMFSGLSKIQYALFRFDIGNQNHL